MSTVYLDFDQALDITIVIRKRDHYDKLLKVKRNSVDYDWADVEEIILEVRKKKNDSTGLLTLKKSTGGIETGLGFMILHLPTTLTSELSVGDYSSLEMVVFFTNDRPKTWWDGKFKVLARGVQNV